MGQKVHPRGFRLGVVTGWQSRWFARKNFNSLLREDLELRKYISKRLSKASVDHIDIERQSGADDVRVMIWSAKPGLIISRGGSGIEELANELILKFFKRKVNLKIQVMEIREPNLAPQVVVQNIAAEIEKRLPFRRVMKQALQRIKEAGALGAKIVMSGRLNGAEIARIEKLGYGSVPLHTIRADVAYGRGAAHMTYGTIGIKVWIYRGEVFTEKMEKVSTEQKGS